MIVNASNLGTIFTAYNTVFNQGFEGATAQAQKIAMKIVSSAKEETYAWLGQLPNLREWVGERVIKNLIAQGYTVKNRKFESTISVSRDDIEDDSAGVYGPLFRELGLNAKQHPDQLIFNLLTAGFTTLCYDGQLFFDTDHPVGDGEAPPASVSNMEAGGEAPWFLIDASRAIRPLIFQERVPYTLQSVDSDSDKNVFLRDEYLYGVRARCNVGFGLWQLAFGSKAALDPTSYAAARAKMMAFKGDNGTKLGVMPTHLVVGATNEGPGRSVVEADLVGEGVSNIWRKSVELIVTPNLD